MRKIASFTCIVFVGIAIASAHSQPLKRNEDLTVLQAVIHVNFEDTERQGHGLKNVSNILKAASDSKIEVVCHGGGIKLVVEEDSKHAEKVKELIARGVGFTACENTLMEKSIPRDKLLSGVKTVSSGAFEVIRKQQAGFSYFKP